MSELVGTKAKALKEAQGLLQSFGFNGFSFQHIADLLGIKKPSLYDHFKSKEDLGQSLIESYQKRFSDWTETISSFSPPEKIGALFELFFKFSSDGKRICPLSTLIADLNSLPKGMQKPLKRMFQLQHAWLKEVIEEGQKKKIFRKDKSSDDLADLILSLGLGCQLTSRVLDDPEKIRDLKTQALRMLEHN